MCEYCHKQFDNKALMKKHVRRSCRLAPAAATRTKFKCTVPGCAAAFCSNQARNAHVRMHPVATSPVPRLGVSEGARM